MMKISEDNLNGLVSYLKSMGADEESIRTICGYLTHSLTPEEMKQIQNTSKDIDYCSPKPQGNEHPEFETVAEIPVGRGKRIPIYQEDIEMLEKSRELAKSIKKNKTLPREKADEFINLPTGPDTTENILEINKDEQPLTRACKPAPTVEELLEIVKKDEQHRSAMAAPYSGEEIAAILKEVKERYKNPGEKQPDLKDSNEYSFDGILDRMSDTHARKNANYGDAAYQGYKEFGIIYYIIQIHNKLNRLKSLTTQKDLVGESIEDTLLDLACYSVMALEALHRND